METIIVILHVVGGVFIVGPMAILPMSAMRAARAGNTEQVGSLATSTTVFTYLSLIVFVLGFGLVGLADPKYDLSVTTPWVLASIVLYLIAFAVDLFIVIPALRRAARSDDVGRISIVAGSGAVALLLVVVVVLMVWKP